MAGIPPPAAAPAYSDAYKKLVNNDDDIVGDVAYALYKRDKIAYAQSRAPTDPPLADYHKNSLGPQAIYALRLAAVGLLGEHTSKAVAVTQAQEQAKYAAGVTAVQNLITTSTTGLTTLITDRTRLRTAFWVGVASGLLATVLFAFFLALAIFLNKNEQNPLGSIYKQLHEGTSEAEKPAKPAQPAQPKG